MRLPVRLKTRLDTRLPVRMGTKIETRWFRRNEGTTDYYSHSSVTVDRIVMDVYPNSDNTGLPSGAPAVTANEFQTIDFAYSGTIDSLAKNGSDYFSGIIANVEYYFNETLIHKWKIDSNTTTETDSVSSLVLSVINTTNGDWKLYTKERTAWVRNAISYPGVTNYMPSPFDPESWSSNPNGVITNIIKTNPTGYDYVGLWEQTGEGASIFCTRNFTATIGSTIYNSVVVRFNSNTPVLLMSVVTGGVNYHQAAIALLENGVTCAFSTVDDTKITSIGDDYFLCQIKVENSSTLVANTFSTFITPNNTPPPVGSRALVQGTFFGIADDWPAVTQERLEIA